MNVRYLAVDLETTGLQANEDQILEVAWAPLTADFEKVEQTRSTVLEITQAARDRLMTNQYVREMHQGNGLIKQALASGVPLYAAEKAILDGMDRWSFDQERLTIFGSSVHFDLVFIRHHMPKVAQWLHYRVFDVTTLISFAERAGFYTDNCQAIAHRAPADIDWSIETARGILQRATWNGVAAA